MLLPAWSISSNLYVHQYVGTVGHRFQHSNIAPPLLPLILPTCCRSWSPPIDRKNEHYNMAVILAEETVSETTWPSSSSSSNSSGRDTPAESTDSAQQESAVSLTMYPPLGQVSQVSTRDVTFIAVLEVPRTLAAEPWELVLRYAAVNTSRDDQGLPKWRKQVFIPSGQAGYLSRLHEVDPDVARLHFDLRLQVEMSLQFTVKYRWQGQNQSWCWIQGDGGGHSILATDSYVIVDQPTIGDGGDDTPRDLPDLIQGFPAHLVKWKYCMSQSPGTRLWSIEAPVHGAEDDMSAFADISLGVPWGHGSLRWFALERISSPWLGPSHGKSAFMPKRAAVLCSFLSLLGKHMVFLGISGLNDVTTLLKGVDGTLTFQVRNDGTAAGAGTVLVAVGDSFESANAAVMYHARSLQGQGVVMGGTDEHKKESTAQHAAEMAVLAGQIRPQWYEEWFDGLGYSTRNGLGMRITDGKVLRALDVLAEHKINISTLIIDYKWQHTDYKEKDKEADSGGDGQYLQRLYDFEADPKTFPKGLKALVSEIRSKHKNIQNIAVWHALLGSWGGISEKGKLAERYEIIEVVRDGDAWRCDLPLGQKMRIIAKEDVNKFYDDFYRFLSDCGVDGVKADAQFMMDTFLSANARRELTHTYLDAWTLACLRHFSNRAISSMSQTPQIIFHSQLLRNRPAVVCRNATDDFFPDVLPAKLHAWHIWANAHNSVLSQHLNVLPDWGVFQTTGPYAGFHAAARCVSGGPVYITDVPGKHNIELIRQMTGPTPRGKTVIFRPSVVGRTVEPYDDYDDGRTSSLLKIGTYHGRAGTGTGILGVFNVSDRQLGELIPLRRFSGVLPSEHYVVRSHVTGRVTDPLKTSSRAAYISVCLDVRGYDILTSFPLTPFERKSRGVVFVGNLGLTDKMTGCVAILSSTSTLLENGRVLVDTTLKALGVLGLYISVLPDMTSIEAGFMITIQGQPVPAHTVSVNTISPRVLEVDIETAWKEMGLESGWANEVEVKIYFPLEFPGRVENE
ncbi:raffinose synthase or seed imbibition protein Sip1-domain-containing protein [Apodospora peruviana]|uniref:Raffinose synthase or seed imbibition protein Sip1-domain-containing protein n=1 Tax=Apodospora peruviana TaxID=516989 RepID=A0AAE0IS77_9PEZI|nr:raffinose synthase or seed imbibition protein Sip1-domain-containing protein [Apodospora peruviana]